jgi:ribonuclease HI
LTGPQKETPAAAISVIAYTPEGVPLLQHSFYIGKTTNNVAEYNALIQGLKMAQKHKIEEVWITPDSELLVRQM